MFINTMWRISLNHVREHNFLFVEFANFNNVRTFALCFS